MHKQHHIYQGQSLGPIIEVPVLGLMTKFVNCVRCSVTLRKACVSIPFPDRCYGIQYAPENRTMVKPAVMVCEWQKMVTNISIASEVLLGLPGSLRHLHNISWLGPRAKLFKLSRSELLDPCTVDSTVSMERPNLRKWISRASDIMHRKWTIEIVSLPSYDTVIFHSCQFTRW